jgi:DNA-binding transcriptional MerR regulator
MSASPDTLVSEPGSDELIVLPEDALVEAAHLSRQRLRRWGKEFKLARPSLTREISPRNVVRLYRFEDAVEVLVVKELLESGKSIQQIRKLVRYLRQEEGYKARFVSCALPCLGSEAIARSSSSTPTAPG